MSEPDLRLDEDEARELLERLESEEYAVEELIDDERHRRMLVRAVVRYDIDEHRDIYDRLAES
jgi:hypothetical protein